MGFLGGEEFVGGGVGADDRRVVVNGGRGAGEEGGLGDGRCGFTLGGESYGLELRFFGFCHYHK